MADNNYNILVIDDDSARQSWFAHHLGMHMPDAIVHAAFNDLQALTCMRAVKFDLVFFDHDLGIGMDGSQIAYEILQNSDCYNIPSAVWIQSENPVGKKNIASKFKSFDPEIRVNDTGFSAIIDAVVIYPDWFVESVKLLLKRNTK